MTEEKQEQIRKLKSWIPAKEVQIQETKQQVQSQEFLIKQIDENVKFGFYIKQQEKNIAEQTSPSSKKLHELELERIKRDLDNSYYQQKAQFVLDGLKANLESEEKILEGIKKKITMVERNYKVDLEDKKDGR